MQGMINGSCILKFNLTLFDNFDLVIVGSDGRLKLFLFFKQLLILNKVILKDLFLSFQLLFDSLAFNTHLIETVIQSISLHHLKTITLHSPKSEKL
jgi:hypothetical protein